MTPADNTTVDLLERAAEFFMSVSFLYGGETKPEGRAHIAMAATLRLRAARLRDALEHEDVACCYATLNAINDPGKS